MSRFRYNGLEGLHLNLHFSLNLWCNRASFLECVVLQFRVHNPYRIVSLTIIMIFFVSIFPIKLLYAHDVCVWRWQLPALFRFIISWLLFILNYHNNYLCKHIPLYCLIWSLQFFLHITLLPAIYLGCC